MFPSVILFKTTLFIFSLVALGLHCCMRASSVCREERLLSNCNVWASHCGGFSCCGAWALGLRGCRSCSMRSVAAAHGHSEHGGFSQRREVAQTYPTLCDPMGCSPPGSSIQGIFQARILEWFAISFSMEFSQSGDQTYISCVGRWISIHCTTREVPVFLTIIAMLHVTALELIHFTAESLYSWPISAHFPLPRPPEPGNHPSSLCFDKFNFLRFHYM